MITFLILSFIYLANTAITTVSHPFWFVDISESRLKVAKSMGADHTLLIKTRDGQEVAKQVEQAMGSLADVTVECSGAESSIQAGIYVSRIIVENL